MFVDSLETVTIRNDTPRHDLDELSSSAIPMRISFISNGPDLSIFSEVEQPSTYFPLLMCSRSSSRIKSVVVVVELAH